jgi:hypothetical protein
MRRAEQAGRSHSKSEDDGMDVDDDEGDTQTRR